jgi:lipase (class 3)
MLLEEAMANDTGMPLADPLALATLQLCVTSYLSNLADIAPAICETPPLDPNGHWKCLWGPEQDNDEANLAFVAGYFATATSTVPQSICVTIRGTDVDVDNTRGILWQVWEDIDGAWQQPMPWAPDGPSRIADGTLDGLATVKTLSEAGLTLKRYLKTFFDNPAHAGVTTYVTGHSLGGCLATIVAAWIQATFPNAGAIVPVVFAGPTAGDANFAMYYDNLFPQARRYQNSLDVVPLALANLDGVDSIYSDNGLDVPDAVWFGIGSMKLAMRANSTSYVQPSNGAHILTGTFFGKDQDDWYAQALHQHHLATYLGLLTGKPVDETTLPPSRSRQSREARLIKRVGPVCAALDKLLAG